MKHVVNEVQDLYNDASNLYKYYVTGSGESSAEKIIADLRAAYENLKGCWQGKDAGVQIQNIVIVHNAMVEIRNALGKFAEVASEVASNYREIQNANGAGLEALVPLRTEKLPILPDYEDNRDTININSTANTGKAKIVAANNTIDQFNAGVKKYYDEIMGNWLSGPDRDTADDAYTTFMNNVQSYRNTLSEVETSVSNAIQNYVD